jgi:hypothetical protein
MDPRIKNTGKIVLGTVSTIVASHYTSKFLDRKINQEAQRILESRQQDVDNQLQMLHNKQTILNNKMDILNNKVDALNNKANTISDILSNTKNNSNFNVNFDGLYAYLDSLSFLQETALVHILIFIYMLLAILNLGSILFANQIIKYFDLENRYPYLNKILQIRAKFQIYYLIWNYVILTIICLGAILLNYLLLNTSGIN